MNNISRSWIILASTHVCLAIALYVSISYADSDWSFPVAALPTGQLLLLGVWFVFGHARPFVRLFVYVSGIAMLMVAMIRPTELRWVETLFFVGIGFIWNLTAVVIPLGIARGRGWRFASRAPSKRDVAQFSIRMVLALTVVVAVLVTIRQTIGALGTSRDGGSLTFPHTPYSWMIFATVWLTVGTYMAAITISSVWSCFGNLKRLPITVFAMTVVSALPPHISWGKNHVDWILTTIFSTLTLVLSLLYLRHKGLRLRSNDAA